MKAFDIYYSSNLVDTNSEFFIKYKELINANESTKHIKYKTAKHHIVPRMYYKTLKLDVDNTEQNIVELYHRDHVLAHYYLFMCSTASGFKIKAAVATQRLMNKASLSPSAAVKDIKILTEEELDALVEQAQIDLEEVYKWVTKTMLNAHKKREVGFTLEEKQKISEATKLAMGRSDVRAKTTAAYNSPEWRKRDSDHVKEQGKNTNLRDIVSAANGVAVRCIETQKEYLSMSRASNDTGIDYGIISRQLKGIIKDTDKLHFEKI